MHLNKSRRTLTKYGLPLLSILTLIIILVVQYDFYYVTNDDIMLESILSGAYGGIPDGHGHITQLYPFSSIIACLYKVLPQISWYGVIFCMAQFGGLYICLVRCMDYLNGIWQKVAACLVVTFFMACLLLYELVLIQFTFVSAMLSATAIFLLVTDQREEENIRLFLLHRLPYLLLFVAGACVRREMGLFALPFMVAGCLYKWLWDGKVGRLKFGQYMVFGICLLGSMALLWGIDKAAYNTPEWQEYIKLNDARANIYDHIMVPAYDANQDFYESLGVTAEEQLLLDNYNFSLSDTYDSVTLEQIETHQEKAFAYRYTIYYVKKIIKNVLENFEMPYRMIILVMYVLLIICFVLTKKYSAVLQVFVIEGFYMLCWFYLLFYNRAPERVTHGLYLWVIILLFAIGLRQSAHIRETLKKCELIVGAIFIVLSGVICVNSSLPKLKAEEAMLKEDTQIWQMTREYCEARSDKLFLLDTKSYATLGAKTFGERTELQNYTLCGGWAVKTPIYKAMLARYGVEKSLYTSISEGQQMYFISSENMKVNWLKNYFQAEGIEITVQCVDEMMTDSGLRYLIYQIN